MANLNIHPAPGLGDLTQGFFVVPQNPLQLAQEGVSRVRTLGEFLDASFVVPQNPLMDYVANRVRPLGQGGPSLAGLGCGGDCGCGCGGSCGGGGGGGLGALDLSTITNLASEDSLGFGLPNWGYAAVAAAAYMFLFAGSTGPSRVARVRRASRAYTA
jgi:hypothetical protein